MEPKKAPDPATPQPIVVLNPRAINDAIQQRQIASAHLHAAEALLQNAVLQQALELGVDPIFYELNVHQNEKGGWEFRAK